jgi:hypothetical protein
MSVLPSLAIASLLLFVMAGGSGPALVAASAGNTSKRAAAPTAAVLLADVLKSVERMAASAEPSAADVGTLTRALVAGKSRPVTDAAIATLASSVAAAMAQGDFDDETVERLAQNLFAAVNNRVLTGREASLLVLDVSLVLADAGAPRSAIDAVIGHLSAICPQGTERADAPVRPLRPSTLSRR